MKSLLKVKKHKKNGTRQGPVRILTAISIAKVNFRVNRENALTHRVLL